MNVIEKFIIEQYSPMITEDSNGIKCLFKHKEGLTDDGVIYFEFAKKGWSKKPIVSKRQFVIVDAQMTDVLQFLNQYYNLSEEDYHDVRTTIVNMAIQKMEEFYGD
jgi:hypothetical protein